MEGPVVVVSAAEALNLQGLLRKIVSGCLQIDIPEEEEDDTQTSKVLCLITSLTQNVKFPGRLPYDLEIIEEWYQSQPDATSMILELLG